MTANSPKIIFPVPKEDQPELFEFYNKNFPNSQWSQEYWNENINYIHKSILIGLKNDADYIGLILGEVLGETTILTTITALAIDLNFRRHGYGTFLVKKFLEVIFTKTAAEKIVLHFRDSNTTSLLKFYTEIGFQNHHKHGTYSNGEDKHYLEMLKNDFINMPTSD